MNIESTDQIAKPILDILITSYTNKNSLEFVSLLHNHYKPLIKNIFGLVEKSSKDFSADNNTQEYILLMMNEDSQQLINHQEEDEHIEKDLEIFNQDLSVAKKMTEELLNKYSEQQTELQNYQIELYDVSVLLQQISLYALTHMNISYPKIAIELDSSYQEITYIQKTLHKVAKMYNSVIDDHLNFINIINQAESVEKNRPKFK